MSYSTDFDEWVKYRWQLYLWNKFIMWLCSIKSKVFVLFSSWHLHLNIPVRPPQTTLNVSLKVTHNFCGNCQCLSTRLIIQVKQYCRRKVGKNWAEEIREAQSVSFYCLKSNTITVFGLVILNCYSIHSEWKYLSTECCSQWVSYTKGWAKWRWNWIVTRSSSFSVSFYCSSTLTLFPQLVNISKATNTSNCNLGTEKIVICISPTPTTNILTLSNLTNAVQHN